MNGLWHLLFPLSAQFILPNCNIAFKSDARVDSNGL